MQQQQQINVMDGKIWYKNFFCYKWSFLWAVSLLFKAIGKENTSLIPKIAKISHVKNERFLFLIHKINWVESRFGMRRFIN